MTAGVGVAGAASAAAEADVRAGGLQSGQRADGRRDDAPLGHLPLRLGDLHSADAGQSRPAAGRHPHSPQEHLRAGKLPPRQRPANLYL